MAYRRKQGNSRPSTFKEEIGSPPSPDDNSSSSIAAKAIRASAAHRDSSLSSAYGQSALSSTRDPNVPRSPSPSHTKDSSKYEYTSMKSLSEPKQGLWGVLARKAKSIIDDDKARQQDQNPGRTKTQMFDRASDSQNHNLLNSPGSQQKTDNPKLQKGLDAITSSLNYIGGTIGNAFEEGRTIVENRTADIIQETRKLQIKKKGSEAENRASHVSSAWPQPLAQTQVQPQMQTDLDTRLKASRDVAMAMAAKAKLLLRELKTVKADLAFAKERCGQLEEENRLLRESREKGGDPEDDDLIRLQLETLLAEKARLAQENSVFARENRFLREIVEYHQLTMQDVIYLDEGNEEVSEVHPIKVPSLTNLQSLATTVTSPLPSFPPSEAPVAGGVHSPSTLPSDLIEVSKITKKLNSYTEIPAEEDLGKRSTPA